MFGIICYILSILISFVSGSIAIYSTTYVTTKIHLVILATTAFFISIIFLILAIIFLKKNIKYLSISGIIILVFAIIMLTVGYMISQKKILGIGVLFVTPGFITFLYGYIIDKKYENFVSYKEIN